MMNVGRTHLDHKLIGLQYYFIQKHRAINAYFSGIYFLINKEWDFVLPDIYCLFFVYNLSPYFKMWGCDDVA